MARKTITKEELENVGKDDKIVDTSRLEIGMVVKNYPAMCELLSEEVSKSRGDTLNAQKKRWKRYFNWEPDGQKYIITDIYDKPLPEMVRENSIYAKFMQLSLMKFLSNQPNGTYSFFTNSLFAKTGMTKQTYRELRDGLDNYDEMFGDGRKEGEYVSKTGVKKTTEITYNRLLRIIDDALKSLDNHAIIHYKREWAVKTQPWDVQEGFRKATEEEEELIAKAEQEAMKQIGTTNKWYAYACTGVRMGKLMSQYIHNARHDLYGAAKWTTIVYPVPSDVYWEMVVKKITKDLKKDDPSIEMKNLTDSVVIDMCKTKLNELVVTAMINEANKKIKDAQKKVNKEVETGKLIRYNRDEVYYLTSSKFINEFTYLVNRYISIKESTKIEAANQVFVSDLDSVEEDAGFFDFQLVN